MRSARCYCLSRWPIMRSHRELRQRNPPPRIARRPPRPPPVARPEPPSAWTERWVDTRQPSRRARCCLPAITALRAKRPALRRLRFLPPIRHWGRLQAPAAAQPRLRPQARHEPAAMPWSTTVPNSPRGRASSIDVRLKTNIVTMSHNIIATRHSSSIIV